MKKNCIIIIFLLLISKAEAQTGGRITNVNGFLINEHFAAEEHFAQGVFLKSEKLTANILTEDKSQIPLLELKPNTGNFTINFMKQAEGSRLHIYDILGNQVIKNIVLSQGLEEISLCNKPKGVYFIEIINGSEKNVSKVVIQ